MLLAPTSWVRTTAKVQVGILAQEAKSELGTGPIKSTEIAKARMENPDSVGVSAEASESTRALA